MARIGATVAGPLAPFSFVPPSDDALVLWERKGPPALAAAAKSRRKALPQHLLPSWLQASYDSPCKMTASAAKTKVLIIEDEPHIVLGLSDALTFEGFEVVSADTGRGGVALAKQYRPQAVILDLMLPDTNGFEVCELLREEDRTVPIIMLSARSSEADKIRGLEAGADDYVTKPFSVGELLARLRAIFRRAEASSSTAPLVFEVGTARIDLEAHSVTIGKRVEQLSFYEVGLLRMLVERSGQPVARDEMMRRIWGIDATATNRTIDNFIVKLRRKIERKPDKPEHILTVYGYGYKLVRAVSPKS